MGEIGMRCTVSAFPNGRAKKRRGGARIARRSTIVDALVDTGAVEILLPRDLVRSLGLQIFGRAPVTLADDRQVTMPVAGPLWIIAFGRQMVTDCLVGPAGCEPLVGQIVLERLDLILDAKKRTIRPRLKTGPVLKLKST